MAKFDSGRYGVWIRIEDTLPWIELEQTFRTKKEALSAATRKLRTVKIKIVDMSRPGRETESYVPMIKIKESR